MHPRRRRWLLAASGLALGAAARSASTAAADEDGDDAVRAGRVLRFPRDHGAHPGARIEWWYATGWLEARVDTASPGDSTTEGGPGVARPRGQALDAPIGFQITFFRHRTGLAAELPGRFAPRQLLFAHAAISDIGARRHLQAQRIARWNGDEAALDAAAARAETRVHIGRWRFAREAAGGAGRYVAAVGGREAPFELSGTLEPTQPLLLQGDAGHSRKGPLPQQASHYYSVPQLRASLQLTRDGRTQRLAGRAWLDHEWSDELLPPEAVGWDWIGFNLADGGALTAFRLRRRDGSALWAGGSHRRRDGTAQAFAPDTVRFAPLREWTSPASLGRYPVHWRVDSPAGRFEVRALMDTQELDGRSSNGAVYWEGLSELFDDRGRVAGRGYLEMTGYARPLAI